MGIGPSSDPMGNQAVARNGAFLETGSRRFALPLFLRSLDLASVNGAVVVVVASYVRNLHRWARLAR